MVLYKIVIFIIWNESKSKQIFCTFYSRNSALLQHNFPQQILNDSHLLYNDGKISVMWQ